MEILFLLVPLSVLLVFGILGLFAWALHNDQFDDLEREGERILAPDAHEIDDDQAAIQSNPEQSPQSQKQE